MFNPSKILYTIPNFDTAGSGIPLLKIANNLDRKLFSPEIACLHGKGDLFQDVIKSDIKVHFINLYNKARPIHSLLWGCFQLSRILNKIKPDIIHSYHYAADYTEPLAAKMANIRWIYTKKNMSWSGPSFRGWKLRSWLADGIVCQNTEMLVNFFPKSKKAELIPIGVDLINYKLQPINYTIFTEWNIPQNSRIMVTIANLVPVKGIEILIGAFEELTNFHPDWRLIIVGDDRTEYGMELKKNLNRKRQLVERIKFVGKQKQKNVRKFLDISELYVQPTLDQGRREGAPIAVLEAMANEKVVIGSNIAGIKDQLTEFPDHLFTAGDITDLKNKLNTFMSNSTKENNNIGLKLSNFVESNYSLDCEKEKLQTFYQRIISSKLII